MILEHDRRNVQVVFCYVDIDLDVNRLVEEFSIINRELG